ncbi:MULTISPECIES: restriction endonuclease subunit S [Antarcticibacterium]|nr:MULTISPECIES: restriction endonuclease subunit S [Antarcticibacterium]
MKEGWEITTLGNIGKVSMCKRIFKKETSATGEIPFYKIGTFGKQANSYISQALYKEYREKYPFPKLGDILLSASGTIGRGVVYDGEPAYFQDSNIVWIDNDQKKVLNEYLYKFYGYCNWNPSKGATISRLYNDDLKRIQIPVPPLEEQKQIVQILDQAFKKLDRAIANIEQNIKNAEELFQAELNEVFSHKGEGWDEKTLGELGKVSMCKRILKKQTTTEGGVPFYKIGTFGKEPNAFIPEEIYNEFRSKYSFPKKGDILISASGTIGRRVVYDGEPAYFQDSNIVWIDNDESEVLNEFLYEFYGVCNWNPSKGATIARLYNDDLRRIKISYPPIEKQKAIVPAIRELKKKTKNIADQYRMKQKNLEELKKSLLEKGFKGELIKEEVTYED